MLSASDIELDGIFKLSFAYDIVNVSVETHFLFLMLTHSTKSRQLQISNEDNVRTWYFMSIKRQSGFQLDVVPVF